MTLFHLVLVAVIQGVTEFLPVSSSGHLILLPTVTGMEDQGQAIDVAVHVGTLLAVMLFFRADVGLALSGVLRLVRGRADTDGARLAMLLIIATVPVVVLGLAVHLIGLADAMRSPIVIGWTMLVFGVVLWWSDRFRTESLSDRDWCPRHAVILGLWQALALIPGASRSGITITGARFLGYARHDAAKLAMLMSIPAIAGSGILVGLDVALGSGAVSIGQCAVAAILAFGAALLALSLMMRLLRSVNFTPYVIYRIVLGALLLGLAYGGQLA